MNVDKKNVYIIGGGPSGIMCAYRLKQLDKNINVTIFEENGYSYKDYIMKDYDKLENWTKFMYDISFTKILDSSDNDVKQELMLGSGLGGGTLHFGLQYIDQLDVLRKSNVEFNSDEFSDIIMDISNILQAKKYDYSKENFPDPLKEIKTLLESDKNIIVKNNKIYSKDLKKGYY